MIRIQHIWVGIMDPSFLICVLWTVSQCLAACVLVCSYLVVKMTCDAFEALSEGLAGAQGSVNASCDGVVVWEEDAIS